MNNLFSKGYKIIGKQDWSQDGLLKKQRFMLFYKLSIAQMCTDTRSSQLNGILSSKIKKDKNITNAIKHKKSVPIELFYFYQDYLGGKTFVIRNVLTTFICY